MAITRTPSKYKGFIFDGIDSKDYGVYITDGSVFGAPERDVEMIEIPGRNGAYALDNGRFSNIEVTYSAGLYFDNEEDFATAINSLRSELCSRKGYCRLEDDVHPNEYRLAVYKSGLEIDTNLKSSDFTITFDCKPQRFLKTGETAQAVTSGGTITNPTLFDASPVLQVEGYGKITMNGSTMAINDIELGQIQVPFTMTNQYSGAFWYDISNGDELNQGDTITFKPDGFVEQVRIDQKKKYTSATYASPTTSLPSGSSVTINFAGNSTESSSPRSVSSMVVSTAIFTFGAIEFTYGTSETKTYYANYVMEGVAFDNSSYSAFVRHEVKFAYNGDKRITASGIVWTGDAIDANSDSYSTTSPAAEMSAYSTVSGLGHPTYIDLDIGEAYMIKAGGIVSLNNTVSIPAELPVLKPGANEIQFDNTVTQLKIVPRWWEV